MNDGRWLSREDCDAVRGFSLGSLFLLSQPLCCGPTMLMSSSYASVSVTDCVCLLFPHTARGSVNNNNVIETQSRS